MDNNNKEILVEMGSLLSVLEVICATRGWQDIEEHVAKGVDMIAEKLKKMENPSIGDKNIQ